MTAIPLTDTDDEPRDLSPAKGLFVGLFISSWFWAVIGWALFH